MAAAGRLVQVGDKLRLREVGYQWGHERSLVSLGEAYEVSEVGGQYGFSLVDIGWAVNSQGGGGPIIWRQSEIGTCWEYAEESAPATLAEACQKVSGDDPVTLPTHYRRFKYSPLHVDVENYGRGILVHKVKKYMMRAPFKGKPEEDMAKALECLTMLIEFDRGNPDWWKP